MSLLLLFNHPTSGGATGTAFQSFVEAGMFLGNWDIDDWLTFTACTHDDTGAAADADDVPSYAIYEDETAAAIVSGNMAKLGAVTGFYTERVQLTAASGFEIGKCYAIRIAATVGTIPAAAAHVLQMGGTINSVSGSIGGDVAGKVLGGGSGTITGVGTSANVTTWKGDVPADLDASGNIPAQLADGVVHGGTTAELALKKAEIVNPDLYGTALLLNAASLGGKGLNVQAADEQNTGLYARWPLAQMQDIADALGLAPTPDVPGIPATGSVYDLLTATTSEPAQLDWHAWATPDGALADLYDDNAIDAQTGSGTTLTAEGATGFAAWVLQEFDGELFVGVGKTPMNYIAAVIGSIATAGATPTFEYALPEEGVAAMCVGTDGKLYVAGVDERANTGDSSIYVRTAAGVWTRKQTVTGWQHICGIREDSMLWIAGQGATSCLMYSSDGGDTWTDTDISLGRVHDVIRLGSYVIATHWDGFATYSVRRSPTVPVFSWDVVTGIASGTGRMVEWQGMIVGATYNYKLFTVDSDGAGAEYELPFTLRLTWNNLVVDTDGYLCVLGTTGVWRTNDLATWKQVWSFSPADTVRSLGTWGDDLVVSTDGATAQVLARPASPEAAQQQMLRDAMQLAPTVSTYETGSVDYYIDRIANGLTGVGLIPLTYTVTEPNGTTPISGVTVELYTEEACLNCVRRGVTNTFGIITFWMTTAGTYWIKSAKDGVTFTLDSEVVTA